MSVPRPSIVVPGNHDGVHLGHRALLSRARAHGEERGLSVVALTFDPHPLALLRPELAPRAITTIERRVELLRAFGADEVHVATFDRAFASLSADEFIERVLRETLDARAVVAGADFHFGRGRAGTPETLVSRGLEVIDVPVVGVDDGARVSSTLVREALVRGDVTRATELLGRHHDLDGVVVHGQARGRTIGFPTANLTLAPASRALPDAGPPLVPADGVYAIHARPLDDAERVVWGGVANVGVRPTVGAGRSIEAHLFDVSRDLYGQRLRVAFVERLRDEQKFDGIDSLVAQIRRDADRARSRTASPDERCTWI